MGTRAETVKEYCRKYPSMKTRPLTALLFKENPGLFNDFEQARTRVRLIRGVAGEYQRGRMKNHIVPYIPETDSKPWSPFLTPKSIHSMLLLYDLHVPYHDKEAVEIAVAAGKKRGVDAVNYAGDFMDCYQISKFVRDPNARDFAGEVAVFLGLESEVSRFLGKVQKIMMEGNHEQRIPTFTRSVAPALVNLQGIQPWSIYECSKRNISWVDRCRPVIFGHLNILHGHEFGGWMSAPVNPARTLYMRSKSIAVMGHLHRDSSHSETCPISKQMISTWSVGCLCGLRPEYRPLNNWSHGFAIATRTDKDKGFRLENYKIIKGKVYPA